MLSNGRSGSGTSSGQANAPPLARLHAHMSCLLSNVLGNVGRAARNMLNRCSQRRRALLHFVRLADNAFEPDTASQHTCGQAFGVVRSGAMLRLQQQCQAAQFCSLVGMHRGLVAMGSRRFAKPAEVVLHVCHRQQRQVLISQGVALAEYRAPWKGRRTWRWRVWLFHASSVGLRGDAPSAAELGGARRRPGRAGAPPPSPPSVRAAKAATGRRRVAWRAFLHVAHTLEANTLAQPISPPPLPSVPLRVHGSQ